MLAKIVKDSVVILFTIGLAMVAIAFLTELSLKDKTNNDTQKKVTVKEDLVDYWGKVPGKLGYNLMRNFTLYNWDRPLNNDHHQVNFTAKDTIPMNVNRTFVRPEWSQTQSTIQYTEAFDYDVPAGYNRSELYGQEVRTANLEALSAWQQMNKKPRYWQAWQALTQIANMMYGANIVNSYYAVNCFYFTFNDRELVMNSVLREFNSANQTAIYEDPQYGMGSATTLVTWVLANMNGPSSVEYKVLVTYFKTMYIDLSPALMENVVGDMSMLGFMVNSLQQTVINTYSHGTSLDDTTLVAIQWGTSSFLDNTQINFLGTPEVPSLGVVDTIYVTKPEFGYWVKNQKPALDQTDCALSNEQSITLFKIDINSDQTLLNPMNMNTFFFLQDEKQYVALKTRFGFTHNCQIDSMRSYLDEMVEVNLQQSTGSHAGVAMGQLLSTTVNQTYISLETYLPFQLTVRALAAGNTNCTEYLYRYTDVATTTSICNQYDFSNLTSLSLFVAPFWYSDPQTLTTFTPMTAANVTAFYNTSDANSMGSSIASVSMAVSAKYDCENTTNCSSTELANLQWGSATVTRDPVVTSVEYLQVGDSVTDWGQWEFGDFCTVNITIAPEYSYYTQLVNKTQYPDGGPELSKDFTATAVSSAYATYGLNNPNNAAKLAVAAVQPEASNQAIYFQNNYNMNANQVAGMYDSLRFQLQAWLMGGPFQTYLAEDLLYGFESDLPAKINTMDLYSGTDSDVGVYVTPVLNDHLGAVASQEFGMYSGALNATQAQIVRFWNGVCFVNRDEQVFNGTGYKTVTQPLNYMATSYVNAELLSDAGNGMQFPMNWDNSNPVRAVNSRTLQIDSFKKSGESTIGEPGLKLTEYQGTRSGDTIQMNNVEVAFTNTIYEAAQGCKKCKFEQPVFVNDKPYPNPDAPDADFFVKIQPESGFTYQMKRESTYTIFMGDSSETVRSDGPQYNPLPDFDSLTNTALPLYDFSENLQANQNEFYKNLKYVASNQQQSKSWFIADLVIGIFFLLLGIAAVVYTHYWGKQQIRAERQEHAAQIAENDRNTY